MVPETSNKLLMTYAKVVIISERNSDDPIAVIENW